MRAQSVIETELNTIQRTEKICRLILTELEQKYKIPFQIKKNSASDTMIELLLSHFKYKSALIILLEKYQVDKRALLLYLTINFTTCFINDALRKKRIHNFLALSDYQKIKVNKGHYLIQTQYGKLEMFDFFCWFQKIKGDCWLVKEEFSNQCHYAVEKLHSLFLEDNITTSEFKSLFGGIYYHSYFTLKDGKGVVDPARNIFYPGTCFETIFKPNVLASYPASEFDRKLLEYQETVEEKDNKLYPVLAIATYKR